MKVMSLTGGGSSSTNSSSSSDFIVQKRFLSGLVSLGGGCLIHKRNVALGGK